MEVQDRDSVDASIGISRRTLLRRSALAGGSLVWAAPVVQTIAAPSAAAGTPLEGISFVAVLLQCGDKYYLMKWEVELSGLVLEFGPRIRTGIDTTGLLIESAAAPEAQAFIVAETLQVDARDDCILLDYRIKHGGGEVGPGLDGQPLTGTTGPWGFQPLPSPPGS